MKEVVSILQANKGLWNWFHEYKLGYFIVACLVTSSNSFQFIRRYGIREPSSLAVPTRSSLSRIVDSTIVGASQRRVGSGVRCHLHKLLANVDESHDKYQKRNFLPVTPANVWEEMALSLVNVNENGRVKDYVQAVTLLRIGLPPLALASVARLAYPTVAMTLANAINDPGVFAVVSQDSSQFIQNILTTSALVFGLLVGQTNYFMYQQQEAIYLALFEEVTMAKSLLEQVALVCQGRNRLYKDILQCIDIYVRKDLTRFNDKEPATLISSRPMDDPLEDILYLTSVGEPSIVYQTVRSLRQARAYRLGALQQKLPEIHMSLLWILFGIVLFTFPLLGAGSQTIGGMGILTVQSWYFGFIVFGMAVAMEVIYELRAPSRIGAYNAKMVLNVMVAGLEEDLEFRLSQSQKLAENTEDGSELMIPEPSVDADGFLKKWQ